MENGLLVIIADFHKTFAWDTRRGRDIKAKTWHRFRVTREDYDERRFRKLREQCVVSLLLGSGIVPNLGFRGLSLRISNSFN